MGNLIALLLYAWVAFIFMQTFIGIFIPLKEKNNSALSGFIKPIKWLLGCIKAVFQFIGYITWKFCKYLCIYWGRFFWNKLGTDTRFGTARFATPKEILKLLNSRNGGLSIDGTKKSRLTEQKSFSHALIVASSGRGKTSNYVVNNILILGSEQKSIVCSDPSGELYSLTSGQLEKVGYDVKVLDITNISNSMTYNPMAHLYSPQDVSFFASTLINSMYGKDDGQGGAFWNNGAISIIEIFSNLLIYNQKPQYQNIPNLYYLITNFGSDGNALSPLFTTNNIPKELFLEYQAFCNQPEKVMLSMVSTARMALKVLQPLFPIMTTDTLEFRTIRSKPTILYIKCRETLLSHYSFIFNIFYSQLFDFFTEKLSSEQMSVYVMLDEAGNLGKIGSDFSTTLTTLRKYKVSISLILQNINQFVHTFGEAQAATIISNTASRIFFPGMDIKSAENVEKLLGTKTITDVDIRNQKASEPYGRPLCFADEVRRLAPNTGLFFHSNERPIKLSFSPYYRNRKFKKMTKVLPATPPTNLLNPIKYLPLPQAINTIIKPNPTKNKYPPFNI